MKLHKSVTPDRVADAAKRTLFDIEYIGICVKCGEETDGVEPDARKYECPFCGEHSVYGVEELLFYV